MMKHHMNLHTVLKSLDHIVCVLSMSLPIKVTTWSESTEKVRNYEMM